MGVIDISKAQRPTRNQSGGADRDRAARFYNRFPPEARRNNYVRTVILGGVREPPVNPVRTEITDVEATTRQLQQKALEMGADDVGVASFDARFAFRQAGEVPHTAAIVYAKAMTYDCMADIGPRSQAEVHRVYHHLDDLGVRLAHQIAAYGYSARMQPNQGDIPLVAFAYLAGLGELGKHGSLISPRLGASFRLGAVTTNMPLAVDGPRDFGFDEVCASCNVCTRFCPGEAIQPDKKEVNGVLRWHVDTPACEPYFHKLYGCKICLMVCPLNSRGVFQSEFRHLAKDLARTKTAENLLALIEQRTEMRYEDFEGLEKGKDG